MSPWTRPEAHDCETTEVPQTWASEAEQCMRPAYRQDDTGRWRCEYHHPDNDDDRTDMP